MRNFIAVLLTLSIPFFLFLSVWQSSRYAVLEKTLADYDKEQYRLIEENRRKVSGIAILLRNERIERIARDNFNMRKASSAEILRIELDGDSLDEENEGN